MTLSNDIVLGTAGHIDHGKTSLVKALTGIDCDRLPEEKARGMTIDIGFAHLDLDGFHVSVVDVPGHERFIRNMLAGATGIDLCLLVVAADDAVMPQTREHLDILQLLGLRHGVIALTKVDLVDDTLRSLAEDEIRDLVRGTFLEHAPIVPVSAVTGAGLDELKSQLAAACAQVSHARGGGWFRMAIDRAFVVQGHGAVATGSVASGSVRVGDDLQWWPRGDIVRVRGLQSHGRAVDEVCRGMRAAINLAGVKHEDLRRGQELAFPGYLRPSTTLSLHVHALASLPKPLRRRTHVRFHLGSAEIMGQLVLLEGDRLEADQWALAQVFLDEPCTATWGQPFVIREASATWTLGGGRVVQPVAAAIRRRAHEALVQLRQLLADDPDVRAAAAAWFQVFAGIETESLPRAAGITPQNAPAVVERLVMNNALVALPIGRTRRMLLHADRLAQIEQRIGTALRLAYGQNPFSATHDRAQIEARLQRVGAPETVRAVVDHLIDSGKLQGDARRVGLRDGRPEFTPAQARLRESVLTAYRQAGYRQALHPSAIQAQSTATPALFRDLLQSLVDEGLLLHIEADLFLHADAVREARRLVTEKLQSGAGLRVSDVRDLLQSSRQVVVPLCGYFDRCGLTRREGDLRFLAQ